MVEEEPGIAEAFQSCCVQEANRVKAVKKAFANYHAVPRVARRRIVEVLRARRAGILTDNKAANGGRQPVRLDVVPVPWMLLDAATGEHVTHLRLESRDATTTRPSVLAHQAITPPSECDR